MTTRQELNATFDVLVKAAVAGIRCPMGDKYQAGGIKTDCSMQLAYAGRIRIEISGRNYRTVVILEGPHAGKSTAPNPTGAKPWKIIDVDGMRLTGSARTPRAARQQPSAPRLMPYAGKGR